MELLRIGLIGDPVAHSYSPRFQQTALDALGIPVRYELWQTPASELPVRIASLRDPQCLGANVTIPHKEAIPALLDNVDPLAARIGAVNTIVHRDGQLLGYNTDAPGLLHALAEQGTGEHDDTGNVSLQGYTAILLGAGGAARGAAFALAGASVTRLIIVNRHLQRAQLLAAKLQQQIDCHALSLDDLDLLTPNTESLGSPSSLLTRRGVSGAKRSAKPAQRSGASLNPSFAPNADLSALAPQSLIRMKTQKFLILNATSLGMHEDVSLLPLEILARFPPDTLVIDMIYNPRETRLLREARMLGLRAVNGLPMLLHQGALSFTLWTGQPAPLEVMREALFRA